MRQLNMKTAQQLQCVEEEEEEEEEENLCNVFHLYKNGEKVGEHVYVPSDFSGVVESDSDSISSDE